MGTQQHCQTGTGDHGQHNVGAAEQYDATRTDGQKIVGVTSLGGSVNRYLGQLKPTLEQRGYEVAIFTSPA